MLSGSYTVESAFVISLILIILGSFITLGFELHDRIVSQIIAGRYVDEIERYYREPIDISGKLDIEIVTRIDLISSDQLKESLLPEDFSIRFMDEVNETLFISDVRNATISRESNETTLCFSLEEEKTVSGSDGLSAKAFVRLYTGLVGRTNENYLSQ